MAENSGPWFAAQIGVAITAAAAAIGAMFKWAVDRRGQSLSHDEKMRENLDTRQIGYLDRLEKRNRDQDQELDDLRVDLAQARRDADRGWWLARWWEGKAHDMRHRGGNLWQMLLAICREHSIPPPAMPAPLPPLPQLEEPKPDQPAAE